MPGKNDKEGEKTVKKAKEKGSQSTASFIVEDNKTYKVVDGDKIPIANFSLEIKSQKLMVDEGNTNGRLLELEINLNGEKSSFFMPAEDFLSSKLATRILEAAGPQAVIYGQLKDLRIAAQLSSKDPLPQSSVTTSIGLNPEGNYLSNGILITPVGIESPPNFEVGLSESSFAHRLRFLSPGKGKMQDLAKHILNDFIKLKNEQVMFPLIGHICLAPFTSAITNITGKKKTAMHLQGPSGSGKTFLGILSMCFFGSFEDRFISWASTPNAIEAEGFYFRDSLYLIDDYKTCMAEPQTVIRVLQAYSEAHGRSRLKPNAGILNPPYIRGLILSTGEDFVTDVESIIGRTIQLNVEAEKEVEKGTRCWERRSEYQMFLPGLIHSVISHKNWQAHFKQFVVARIASVGEECRKLSNGLRVASNWALNAWGFACFVRYLHALKVIGQEEMTKMMEAYDKIVNDHLEIQVADLESESAVELFFRTLGQKLEAGAVAILELKDGGVPNRGKIIGKEADGKIYLFPDPIMELLVAHFRAVGQRMPFTKMTLRTALAQDKHISRPKDGRWTRQVRAKNSKRINSWEFDAAKFKKECGITGEDSQNGKAGTKPKNQGSTENKSQVGGKPS